ncbi:hypothetical protein IEQ34_015375 [Dendrobium chrysotoxum]|uniref:Cytochrome P450 n=1 Tax=Dendrobium chrysotoxum TaxID=161865 RepID=A0AAV7GIT8_DENCH|nr:hypothetical protein IEQ34_015375 [Dendrobium chrysotoxum]
MASIDLLPLSPTKDSSFFIFSTLPTLLPPTTNASLLLLLLLFLPLLVLFLTTPFLFSSLLPSPRPTPIPGPRGLPFLGSLLSLSTLPHRTLAKLSRSYSSSGGQTLLSFSIGSTTAVISSDPTLSRELLSHPLLSNRPLKLSARQLLFSRSLGFSPYGPYWRLLRRISSTHLFSPRSIAVHANSRASDASILISRIATAQKLHGCITLRPHIQAAALDNIMGVVYGRRYDEGDGMEIQGMVREGFELLGGFSFADYVGWLGFFHRKQVGRRCEVLVGRVKNFFGQIIEKHRGPECNKDDGEECVGRDFVDVLLSLRGEEKLDDEDIIAILWEMVFRGTDTTALLTEWAIAELVLNPGIQARLRLEIDDVVGSGRAATDADVERMPYLQAIIKETLRAHPPGPLLSWARLATGDVQLSNGMVVPAGTTTMVNMWAIAHDEKIWDRPDEFSPERFIVAEGGADVDVRGGDLRLAPFGSGRRVCPGRNLGLITVGLWVARLAQCFEWVPTKGSPVCLDEVLKLSLEMKNPLVAVAIPRENFGTYL